MPRSRARSRRAIASLIGVDAGATKTAAAFAKDGTVARIALGPPANPTLLGVDDAADAIVRTIRDALRGERSAAVDAIYIGAAGAGSPRIARELESLVAAAFSRTIVRVGDDAAIALRAAIPSGPGVVLVAGTGSIALASDADGELHRAGGLGYLLGDEGSAAWIGLEAVRHLGRAYDGRARDEETAKLAARHLGASDRPSLIAAMYGEKLDVARIAALAPSIIAFAGKGNRVSRKIVERAAAELTELTAAAAHAAGILAVGPKIAFSGGLLREENLLTALVRDILATRLAGSQIVEAGDPLDGALRCAAALTT